MLCGFIKIQEWLFIDSGDRLEELNKIFENPQFQKALKDCDFYPTLIR